ncbi:carbohydrate ABC transporter permease [Nitratireductor sp. CH_MIT9313-5]|uniref:carbohydrate ABC transporter permease n=1 Tax=Nitratireductor sp. CH_MIT9313-5 TaxID=3107764 RepID=UPI003009BAF5
MNVPNIARWVVFVVAAFAMNFPVIATLVTAFKTPADIASNASLIPTAVTFENFKTVFTVSDRLNIWAYLWNSLSASLIGAILPILLSLPLAYAIARRDYGRAVLLPLVVNLRAMPLIIFAIPLYMMYQTLGLLDTRIGLGLILAVVNLPLALVLLVNAVAEIPREIDEAALMDGTRTKRILSHLVLPLIRPALATTFVFGFMTAWNEFLFGLMLTTRAAVPVTVGASFFFSAGGGGVQWGVAAAVIVVASAPPVLLGLFMYRQIGRSMLAGAVKG